MRAFLLALIAACAHSLVLSPKAPALSPARLSPPPVRMQESPPPPPNGRLGATVDQDGKSNVWAVEPTVKVESEEKGLMAFAPVAGAAALALVLVPLLPLLFAANPDQA